MKKLLLGAFAVSALLLAVVVVWRTELAASLFYKYPNAPMNAQGQTLAEELGYPADAKLLVVNSDDTGAHPTLLAGAVDALEFGIVKSTSIIVNDRNDDELRNIASVAKQHPQWGFGIHLMLTNEYQDNHGWAPVLPKSQVPSLYNDKGYAWQTTEQVGRYANPSHVALELAAQIEKAQRLGIQLTHIDSHMGTLYVQSSYPNAAPNSMQAIAVDLAQRYHLPLTMVSFDQQLANTMALMDELGLIRPDVFFGFYELEEINPYLAYEGSELRRLAVKWIVKILMGFNLPYQNYFTVAEDQIVRRELLQQAIKNFVKPGLNHIFIHAAKPFPGMPIPKVANREKGLDSVIRLSDLELWSSAPMQQFLQDENIVLINYTQLQRIQRARLSSNNDD